MTQNSYRARFSTGRTAWLSCCLAAVMLLVMAHPASAQVPAGQIDLVALGFAPVAEATVDLHIGAAEFDLAALATQATDPDLAQLLGAVEAFHLKQFSTPDAATTLAATQLATGLIVSGWLPAKTEFQGTRQVVVYVRPEGLVFAGLVIVAVDAGREVSIANVVGNIAPQQLATLGLPVPH